MINFYFDVQIEYRNLIETINKILEDSNQLNIVAAASYTHVLGFDKMVLQENSETGDKLCIHFWWPQAPDGDDHVHPHRWNFTSLALLGEILVEKYQKDLNGRLFYQYKYESPKEKEHSELIPYGTDKITLYEKLYIKEGESYIQEYDELHRVIRKTKCVVTLFTQSPPLVEYTLILSAKPIKETSMIVDSTRMSVEYVKKCLNLLKEQVAL